MTNSIFAQAQQDNKIGVKIISPITGQQVPVGELTISGISTDNATSDCTVYADWNNLKPFQTATATGPGGVNDYSTWNFTYTADYHLITNGSTNELTSKLSCINNPTNLTKWYSINVIGALSDQNQQQQSVSTLGNTTTLDNVTAATTIAARGENESVRNVLPIPTVREEEQPSASTTDKNAEPVKSPLPSSPVTSTTSSESKNTTKNKEDTTIKTMNQIAIKTINQIAQRVASTNPDTNPVQVQQILVQLAKQTAQTASKEKAIEELRQIYSQVTIYPFGTVSQSLSNFAQHLASGDNVAYIIEQIIQEKARGKNISQSLVSTLGNTTTLDNVTAATTIAARGENESVRNVLPIPTVREEEQPSASTTDKNAEPVKSPLPSSPVTSTTSSESKNTTKNKEDTTIKTMNQIAIKTINQIVQRVASTNPDTNPVQVQQILVQLAKQTAQTASKEKAIEELRQIYSQVTIYPFGTVSQSLSNFAQHLASGDNVAYIIEQIIQEKARGKNISQSLVSTLGNTTTLDNVTAATTIAARGENESVRNVLPIPTVREEEQPSASTTDKNAEPVKSPLPSSPVTSTTSSESKNTTKNKEDTTIKTMNQIAIKTINQIAQRVASTNPDTNPVQVQQILVQLAKQTAQTASKEKAIEELRQIYSQVTIYPFGTVSQSLSNFAQHLASGDNVAYIIEQIIQEKARGKNISQSLVSTLGNTTTLDNVTAATTIAARGENESVRNVLPIPTVREEEQPSASTTDKNAEPVKSPLPSSPVTSTTSSESKNTTKNKEDTTIKTMNQIAIKTINQIAQRVASTNPDTNPVQVQQILVQLAKQTAQTASKEKAIEELRQIYSQVTIYPFGTVSQSLSNFAQHLASGDNVAYIIEQIIQEKARGKNISQSLVSTLGNTTTLDNVTAATTIAARGENESVRNVLPIPTVREEEQPSASTTDKNAEPVKSPLPSSPVTSTTSSESKNTTKNKEDTTIKTM